MESGVGIQNPLFFIGVVENNLDERLEGRVQVRAFGVHGTVVEVPTEDLPWAIPISGSYDPNTQPPAVNSWVFGFFIDGRDAQQPMILGLIPTQMTEVINPVASGWGAIPAKDADLLSVGKPENFGQPTQSRLMRGENIEETYVLEQELNRVKDLKIGGDEETTWSEPSAAYNSQYPFNKVMETPGGHSIELDDTPGAERIMIHHKSGSYVQIDTNGTKTDKAVGDSFEINDANHHVYVGGKSMVTIQGDCHVMVQGNKTEEIIGDYVQIIRGNHLLAVAGQANINASDEIQFRAAKLKLEANVESVSIKSAKDMSVESSESVHIKAGTDLFQEATGNANLKGTEVRLGGGSRVDIQASNVHIDDYVDMANGSSNAPDAAGSSEAANLPEPPTKGVSTTKHVNLSSRGSGGYVSQDDGSSNLSAEPLDSSVTEGALKPLLDLIGKAEGAGYATVFGGSKVRPGKALTSMSIKEVLEWQDRSVAAGSVSSAAGRYQIIRGTLRDMLTAGVATLSDTFGPETQDKLGIHLLQRRGLNRYMSGSLTREQFANNLAKEWASFPVVSGPGAGSSFYSGVAGNKSRVSSSEVLKILDELKQEGGMMV